MYQFLIEIEETLEIPNFDSSYTQMENFENKVSPAGVTDSFKKKTKGPEIRWTELE